MLSSLSRYRCTALSVGAKLLDNVRSGCGRAIVELPRILPASVIRTAALSTARPPALSTASPIVQHRKMWSRYEDGLLTEGVKEYGFCWTKISTLLPGRTRGMCERRWKTVLDPAIKRGPWLLEEDEKLRELAEKTKSRTGTGKWTVIARSMGRPSLHCLERWKNHLNPKWKKDSWSPDEDAKLLEQFQQHPNEWAVIASQLPGRQVDAVRRRHMSLTDSTRKVRVLWSVEEDKLLVAAARKYQYKHWGKVACEVPGRSARQCLNRWKNLQGPINAIWTEDEDALLIQAVNELGSDDTWADIAGTIPGKTAKECKERWKEECAKRKAPWLAWEDAIILKMKQGGENGSAIAAKLPERGTDEVKQRIRELTRGKHELWTAEEIECLRIAVLQNGENQPKNWKKIAESVWTRTARQCMERYIQTMRPARKPRGVWASDEMERLRVAALQYDGKLKNWRKIAQSVSTKSAQQCRQRYYDQRRPLKRRCSETNESEMKIGARENVHVPTVL